MPEQRDRGGDFVWPGCGLALPGVPPGLLSLVRGPINFETFVGVELSARSATGYLTTATGGAVSTSAAVAPDAGDVITRGLWRITLNADPVSTKGIARRLEVGALGIDCYGADRPTIFASRFRSNGPEPTAGTYECCVGGISSWASSSGVIQNGPHIIFSPVLQRWICLATRAGVSAPVADLGPYDNDFHTAGFLHQGDAIVPFFDDEVFDQITAAEIQPAASTFPMAHRLRSFAAGGDLADLDIDFIAWGS